MLDISFYSKSKKAPITIDVSEQFYKWLINSDFSEIGVSRPQKIKIDDEEIELNLVDLNKGKIRNRQRFRDFLVEVIVQEVGEMLTRLGNSPSKQEYQDATYTLKKLQQIKMYIEDEHYQFVQRA